MYAQSTSGGQQGKPEPITPPIVLFADCKSGDTVTGPDFEPTRVVGINHSAGYVWLSNRPGRLTETAFNALQYRKPCLGDPGAPSNEVPADRFSNVLVDVPTASPGKRLLGSSRWL